MKTRSKSNSKEERSAKRRKTDETTTISKNSVKKRKVVSSKVSYAVFAKHLEIGREVIEFNSGRKECGEEWERLKGTEWAKDETLLLKALSCDLDPKEMGELARDRRFVMKAFKAAHSRSQVREIWNLLSPRNQSVMQIAFAAVRAGLPFAQLPASIQESKKCLLEGIGRGLLHWTKLPLKLKRDVDLALASKDAPSEARPQFRSLLLKVNQKDMLWKEWGCSQPEMTHESDWELAPEWVTSNRELMAAAAKVHPQVTRHLDATLALDLSFILNELLQENILSLSWLPRITYNEHTASVLNPENFRRFYMAGGAQHNLKHAIPPRLWSDRKFAMEWVASDGNVHSDMPEETFSDKEVFLTLACSPALAMSSSRRSSFSLMSDELKADKEFVLELCELTSSPGDFFGSIHHSLRKDDDVLISACAKEDIFHSWQSAQRDALRKKLEKKVINFQGFFTGILCGAEDPTSQTFVLNQGTDKGIKEHIASFVDFPQGKQLLQLQAAAKNLGIQTSHPYGSL